MSADADDGREAQLEGAENVEEFLTKNRLRSLFEARDTAAEAIRTASLKQMELREKGQPPAAAKRVVGEHVHETVRAYCLECEPLLRNTEAGRQLLHEEEIETITLPLGKGTRTIRGIADFIQTRTFVVEATDRSFDENGMVIEDKQETVTIPRSASEAAYRKLNTLLADLGIGLDAEVETDDVAEFEYTDLL